MKQKIVLIIVLVIAVFAIAFYFVKYPPKKTQVQQPVNPYTTYTDSTNKVSFQVNKDWKTTTSNQFTTAKGGTITVLITTNPIDAQLEGLGLNTATESLTLGTNTFKLLQKDFEVKLKDKPTTIEKYTYYLLETSTNKYLFEVYPQQKPTLDKNIQEILQTFKPL